MQSTISCDCCLYLHTESGSSALFRNVGKRLPEFKCHIREDSLVWLMGDNFSAECAVYIFRVEQRGPEIT
jgi:hypothetical protein